MNQQDEESKVTSNAKKHASGLPFWKVMLSVIQASFGVQNSANKERDFKEGKAVPFIIAALLFTLIFILTIVGIVKVVLST